MYPFVHRYVEDYPSDEHTFKGSRRRHVSVENSIYLLQNVVERIGDAFPLYDYLYAPIVIAFGLNCNFPLKDIAQYVAWHLKGYP